MGRLLTEWIDRLVQRNPEAWSQFITNYGALIRSRVLAVAGANGNRFAQPHSDSAIADDLTAEVFSTLIANDCAVLRAFAFRSSFKTYLAVIATRVASRTLAKYRALHNPVACNSPQFDPVANAATAEQLAISQEQQAILLHLVDRLPSTWRQLVLAHYRDGMTYQQISDRFGVPLGSIGVTLRRAESRLRGWMEGDVT